MLICGRGAVFLLTPPLIHDSSERTCILHSAFFPKLVPYPLAHVRGIYTFVDTGAYAETGMISPDSVGNCLAAY
jgi:hypothetical protein